MCWNIELFYSKSCTLMRVECHQAKFVICNFVPQPIRIMFRMERDGKGWKGMEREGRDTYLLVTEQLHNRTTKRKENTHLT